MNRQQKEAVVSEFHDFFQKAHATFLINYNGVSVGEMQRLRSQLRQNEALLKITKARLMKIAFKGIEGADGFADQFKDQVGLVFALGEVSSAAKSIVKFSKDLESFKIVSGFFEKQAITEEDICLLASLPSREA